MGNFINLNYLNGKGNYGFTYNSNKWSEDLIFNTGYNWSLATDEEVFEALKNEAVKRGFKDGVYVNRSQEMLDLHDSPSAMCEVRILDNNFNFDSQENYLSIDGRVIFIQGKWAKIINKKKMTQEQIESELGYEIEIIQP